MNEQQAIGKLKKLLGPRAAWRVDPKAPLADERAAALAARPAASKAVLDARTALDARRAELLRDPEYVHLLNEWQFLKRQADLLAGASHRHRITVGRNSGIALHVVAEGDNWAEVIEKLEAKQKEAA
jgi:hypothetical protein